MMSKDQNSDTELDRLLAALTEERDEAYRQREAIRARPGARTALRAEVLASLGGRVAGLDEAIRLLHIAREGTR